MPKEDEITRLEYLGQKWSSQKPKIKDWACNIYADKTVAIDVLIEALPESSRQRKILEKVKKLLIDVGEALYIKNSDTFTNLCIKVGSSLRRAKFQK